MKVILEVAKGPNRGSRYELVSRGYRAVGRAGGGAEVTVQLLKEGDRQLEPDDIRVVEEHLARRGERHATGDIEDTNLRIGAFRRGRDILLDDDKISRKHAMFFLDDDGPSVVDLLSTNGTHVNGKKVGDADLEQGDIVNIGKTRFTVCVEESDEANDD